jgi:hypothetical protein
VVEDLQLPRRQVAFIFDPNGSGGRFVQYHHPDRLGTRVVTNAQDTNYFEQQTLPFGTGLNESPPTGGTTDATNRRFTTTTAV